MDTRGRPSLLWLRRLAVVTGFAFGGWLLGTAPAGADTDLGDLAHQLIDRAAAGEDISALVRESLDSPTVLPPTTPASTTPASTTPESTTPESSAAQGGTTQNSATGGSAPAVSTAAPEPAEPEATSSAAGSAVSVRGVAQVNTTTYGGVDYGLGPADGSAGWAANRVEPVPAPTSVVKPATEPRSSGVPPPAAQASAPASVPANVPAPDRLVAEAPAPAPAASRSGERTAPAEQPTDLPAPPPAPAAPGSGSTAGSASDGGGSARGALGVLSTRDHASNPESGWSMAFPQVHGAAVDAAGSPASRPD